MATRPTLHRAVAKTKNTASDYNDNFDMMMDFIDDSIAESKDYVDGFMPSVTGQAGKVLSNDGTDAVWLDLLPAGCEVYFAGETAPSGWLVRDGSAVSRVTYAKLFSAIGTKYGEGDGSTTFNLPDDIGKYTQGNTDVGVELEAKLPDHTHGYTALSRYGADGSGGNFAWWCRGDSGGGYATASFTMASASNSMYNGTTVQPPSLTKLPIIKY